MQALAHRLSTSYPVYKKIWNTLKEDESHPFSITDYFSFLGYQSKGACKRAVMNHPQADFIETQRLMNERHAPDLMLEKGFFLELARKRKMLIPGSKTSVFGIKASDCESKFCSLMTVRKSGS